MLIILNTYKSIKELNKIINKEDIIFDCNIICKYEKLNKINKTSNIFILNENIDQLIKLCIQENKVITWN